jgi:tetratricopeptide (TPR) repeat protein
MNELIKTDTPIQIDYTPSTIEIKNESKLEALVENTVNHYKNLTFSEGDIQGAKDARSSLNNIIKLLEEKRKEVKNGYSEPLKSFEAKIKKFVDQMETAKEGISQSLEKFEATERDLRLQKVTAKIEDLCNALGIEPNEIEIPDRWTNKGAFTVAKGELTKAINKEIADTINEIASKKQTLTANKQAVESYAQAVGLDPFSWSCWIDQGHELQEVFDQINQVVAERKEKLAQAASIIEKVEQQAHVPLVPIDRETGEILKDPTQEMEGSTQGDIVTLKLRGSEEQFNLLNQSIVQLGIEVVEVIE